ncbi:heterokaryon incompatibility protein-domain-containing protein [Podospora conica]|nr:heterokaryon incompatibility protein-domain-containing protein [Schizothecium conicum]
MADTLYNRCPLPPYPGHIRLLRLHPSPDASAPLSGTIFPTTFDAVRGTYEALSYCWGDDAKPDTINLHLETEDEHTSPSNPDGIQLPITSNLAEALADVRSPSSDRLFWIDAVSIDQSKNGEKSIQVRQMYDVYANSLRTLVYLGRGGSEEVQAVIAHRDYLRAVKIKNEKVVDFIRAQDTGTLVTWDPAVGVIRAGQGAPAKVANESDCLDYRTIATLPDTTDGVLFAHCPDLEDSWERILGRQWTTRAWTTQEFVAGPDVLMQLGPGDVFLTLADLENLFQYCECRHVAPWTEYDHRKYRGVYIAHVDRLKTATFNSRNICGKFGKLMTLRLRGERSSRTIAGILGDFTMGGIAATILATQDPRDVLWSLLALGRDNLVPELQPDYNLGTDEVYRRFSIHIATQDFRGLRLLLRMPLLKEKGAPSWRMGERLQTSTSNRVYGLFQRTDSPCSGWVRANSQGTELTVPGVIVDSIARLAPPLPYRATESFRLRYLRFVASVYSTVVETATWPGLFLLQDESPEEAVFKFLRGQTRFASHFPEEVVRSGRIVPPSILNLDPEWQEYYMCWCATTLAVLDHVGNMDDLREEDQIPYDGSVSLFINLPFFDKVRRNGWPINVVRNLGGSVVDPNPNIPLPRPEDLTTFEACRSVWRGLDGSVCFYAVLLHSMWTGKSIGMSKRGHLCHLDKEARVGDGIAMLRDVEHAVILRKQPSGAYIFVGKAYAHGLLEGMEMHGDVEEEIRIC